jgi:hypothetical protein
MEKNLFELRKALDTSSTNGNNVLDPVLLSKIVTDQVRRMPTLRNMIKRLPWETNFYTWDSIISHGLAQTATDGATLNFSDASFSQNNAKMSYFYDLFAITNPAILAAEALLDVVATRIEGATKQLLRLEGAVIYNGDPVNSSNPGLNAALAASPTQGYVGANATLSRGLLSSIDMSLRANGYAADVIVCSPRVFTFLAEVSFNQVRFIGTADGAQIGYSLAPSANALSFNGIPVIMDPYAGNYVAVTNSAMVSAGANTYSFANNNVQIVGGQNFAGSTWNAPVITVGGTTVPASAYTLNASGTVTFNSTPSATPQASYTYQQDGLYFLSLNPADLVIAEQMSPTVENDLGKPAQLDAQYYRVKEYATLAVRNPLAHVAVLNLAIPASITSF